MQALDYINTLINTCNRAIEETEKLEKERAKYIDMYEDFRHIHEFATVNAAGMVQLYSEGKQILQKRRTAINELDGMRCLRGVLDKHSKFIQELEYVRGKLEKMQSKQLKQRYAARTREGQALVDKFAKPGDDLMRTEEVDLGELKEKMEMKNAG